MEPDLALACALSLPSSPTPGRGRRTRRLTRPQSCSDTLVNEVLNEFPRRESLHLSVCLGPLSSAAAVRAAAACSDFSANKACALDPFKREDLGLVLPHRT